MRITTYRRFKSQLYVYALASYDSGGSVQLTVVSVPSVDSVLRSLDSTRLDLARLQHRLSGDNARSQHSLHAAPTPTTHGGCMTT